MTNSKEILTNLCKNPVNRIPNCTRHDISFPIWTVARVCIVQWLFKGFEIHIMLLFVITSCQKLWVWWLCANSTSTNFLARSIPIQSTFFGQWFSDLANDSKWDFILTIRMMLLSEIQFYSNSWQIWLMNEENKSNVQSFVNDFEVNCSIGKQCVAILLSSHDALAKINRNQTKTKHNFWLNAVFWRWND